MKIVREMCHTNVSHQCVTPTLSRTVPIYLELNDFLLHERLRHHYVGVAIPSEVTFSNLSLSIADPSVDLDANAAS